MLKSPGPVPAQICQPFLLVGKSGCFPQIDKSRKVAKRASTQVLKRIVERRNLIAHTGDLASKFRDGPPTESVDRFRAVG